MSTVPIYTAEDHKRAYQTFVSNQKMNETSKALNISEPTLRAWRSDGFLCPMGCAYHGWDKLMEEGRKVAEGKVNLIQQGTFDPVATSNMIEGIVGERPVIAAVYPTVEVTLTQRQRLAHWYYLYCHVFYQVTRIALDHTTLHDALSGALRVQATNRYEMGLQFNNAGDAVRVLSMCQDNIRTLEDSINGFTPGKKDQKALPHDPLQGFSDTEIRNLVKEAKKK